MAQVFKQSMKEVRIGFVENQWTLETLICPPKQCFEIYQNAIFVLCGRGNYKLECFRIYEAIVAGAIPVIAGTTDEIKTTFHYSHRIPPIVHDESWERVVVKCNQLLENPEELQRMQDDLLLWWRETIEDIRGLIRKIENKSLLCI
jgi:hypothetical protein